MEANLTDDPEYANFQSKMALTTTTSGPLSDQTEEPALLSPTISNRSRRPTLLLVHSASAADLPPLMPVPSSSSQLKQKWTLKRIGLAVWTYVTTVKGFLITVYMLNVVAWGGMLFLLLVEAAPAMCHPTCNDLYSARRIWVEIDSQILNALFCVTGLGLLPWRLRDTWLLVRGNWQKLSVIHAGWYIDGVTKRALMWWVIMLFLQNSVWQIVMAVTMWSLNRFNRPSWVTGVCIAVSFLCAMAAGGIEWWEVRRRKKLQRAGKLAPPIDEIKDRNNTSQEKPKEPEDVV